MYTYRPVPAAGAVLAQQAQVRVQLEGDEALAAQRVRRVGGRDVHAAQAVGDAPLLLRAVAVHALRRPRVLPALQRPHLLEKPVWIDHISHTREDVRAAGMQTEMSIDQQ